ncbi:winged helix-turn-helix domain-containing protein [Pelagibius marinus]|uniref:winged helix-turn-helix domain-containing protein n=1 Tax=Pelagibius marinus TaxID=2762760 RepID=UPI001872EC56|nr:winged helix-turn-helix domain-containing protein [Pelagibius marinus]
MASFKLDISEERLWRGDQPLPISNKAFQLLRLFVSNPNRLLTKNRILEDAWQGLCVSEGLIKEYVMICARPWVTTPETRGS